MSGTSSDVLKFWRWFSKGCTLDVWSYCLYQPRVSSAFENEEKYNTENEKYYPRYHASNYYPGIRIGGASTGKGLRRISQYQRCTYLGVLLSWGAEGLVVVLVYAVIP